MGKNQNILVVNAGSSSIKLDLFFVNTNKNLIDRSLSVSITNIGQPSSTLTYCRASEENRTQTIAIEDHTSAVYTLVNWLSEANALNNIDAIGHRIVHGGPKFTNPEFITNELVNYLKSNINLDLEHVPVELLLIEELSKVLPDVPQIACFDTAYFSDMPRLAKLLSIPKKYQEQGLQRYGFHGLSYTYLDSAFSDLAGEQASNGRVIYAHLGSGASLTATNNGKPIDTTMGFTPASGIIMSTRAGDLDPGVSWYLQKQLGLSPDDFNHMINFESGLLGVSGLTADMYELLQNEDSNVDASDAVGLFVYQVKKAIGSLATVLGGLDSLVFSGGIGEKSAPIRTRVCSGLEFLGIEIDPSRNDQNTALISADNSRVGVHVIATDEAIVICKQVTEILDVNESRGAQ